MILKFGAVSYLFSKMSKISFYAIYHKSYALIWLTIKMVVKKWYWTVGGNICFMMLWNQKVSLKYFFLNASCCHHRFCISQKSRCLRSYLDKSFNQLNFQSNIVPYHLNWIKKLQIYNNYSLFLETILKDLVVSMGWVRGCSEYTALRFRFPKIGI